MRSNTKKATTITLLAVCLSLAIFALAAGEIPRLISYQGKVTNADGTPVPDGNHTVKFDLYSVASAGISQWNETATITTNSGLFTHLLGSVTPMSANRFGNDSLFLQITYEGQVQTPRTRLTSVPYARRVHTISGAEGGAVYDDLRMWDRDRGIAYASFYIGSDGEPELYMDGTSRNAWIDLGQTGSQSVQLPSNAIQATELKDEPGVGGYINETGFQLGTGTTYLGGRTMFAPADGYVLVLASGSVKISHVSGNLQTFYIGVADNVDSLHDATKLSVRVGSSQITDYYHFPVTAHGLFAIDSGSHAYYFLAEGGGSSCEVDDISITEIFIPTAYTTVTPPNAAITAALYPAAERVEAEAFHRKRLETEVAQIKAELEAIRENIKRVATEPASGGKD